MNTERFKQEVNLAPDQDVLRALAEDNRDQFQALTVAEDIGNIAEASNRAKTIFSNIIKIDQMGRAFERGPVKVYRVMGQDTVMRGTLLQEITDQDAAGNNEQVMQLLRVGHILDYTEDPWYIRVTQTVANYVEEKIKDPAVLRFKQWIDQQAHGQQTDAVWGPIFDKNKADLDAKRAAAAAGTGGGTTGPGTGAPLSPDWLPEDVTTKSPEWVTIRQAFEAAWDGAAALYLTTHNGDPLPDDPTFYSTLDRFTFGFNLVQREILSSPIPSGKAVQNMIEYITTKIWLQPSAFPDFFDQCKLEPPTQRNDDPHSVADLDDLAAALLIRENIRKQTDPLNASRQGEITRIYRRLTMGTHPDRTKIMANPDANPVMHANLEELFKLIDDRYKIIAGKLFS